MLVGQKIRKLRELRNYTQEYMATQLDLSQKAYCNIETNQTKVSVERLAEIAKILAVDVISLMMFDEQQALKNVVYNNGDGYSDFLINNGDTKENELLREMIRKQDVEISFLRSIIEKLQNPPAQ